MDKDTDSILLWNSIPDSITELVSFKNKIKKFKSEKAIRILNEYHSYYYYNDKKYPRFQPQKSSTRDRRNVGVFTTALCLDVLSQYKDVINVKDINDESWIGEITKENPNGDINPISWENYFEFIILGLSGDFKSSAQPSSLESEYVAPGDLSIISSLNKLNSFLINGKHNVTDTVNTSYLNDDIKNKYYRLIVESFHNIHGNISSKNESLHPFYLHKSLIFLDGFKQDIVSNYHAVTSILMREEDSRIRNNEPIKFNRNHFAEINRKIESEQILDDPSGVILFNHYFNNIYLLAKYELYRQMALHLAKDMALYDVKRLLYSLLTVSYENRFSNNLIQKRALNMIFEAQRDNPNQLWASGQLIPLSIDALMSISSIECASDLLSCKPLISQMSDLFLEIKAIFDFHARTIQNTKNQNSMLITGWYPPHFRDKTPLSYITAFVLCFIKKYCELITHVINLKAKTHFINFYKTPTKSWDEIHDCTSVKSKLKLMISDFCKKDIKPFSSAILFGPPGTGKSSFAKALSSKLGWDYLELTPGVFFSGGDQFIIENINRIFENMLHLQNTVVFIDEIDDFIMSRESQSGKSFDPRNMYVNTLLPKFQELHDNDNLILILATNNYSKVDEAIARLGRIDLIIPVGHLSPYGRLSLLFSFFREQIEKIVNKPSKYAEVIKGYLRDSTFATYVELKMALEKIQAEERNNIEPINSSWFKGRITSGRKAEFTNFNKLVQNPENQKLPEIRPKAVNDFYDFYDSSSSPAFGEYSLKSKDCEEMLIEASRILFTNLSDNLTEYRIKTIVDFGRLCIRNKYYNIITPFFDCLGKLTSNNDIGNLVEDLRRFIINREMINNDS
jgi:hypothetical protein